MRCCSALAEEDDSFLALKELETVECIDDEVRTLSTALFVLHNLASGEEILRPHDVQWEVHPVLAAVKVERGHDEVDFAVLLLDFDA